MPTNVKAVISYIDNIINFPSLLFSNSDEPQQSTHPVTTTSDHGFFTIDGMLISPVNKPKSSHSHPSGAFTPITSRGFSPLTLVSSDTATATVISEDNMLNVLVSLYYAQRVYIYVSSYLLLYFNPFSICNLL